MAHVGRLQAVGIWPETTAGTKVSAAHWPPKVSGVVKPMVESIRDTSGYGVIDEVYNSDVIKEMTVFPLSGNLSDQFAGYLLFAALGAKWVSGAWPYTHTFTRLNSNSHKTFTLWGYDPVGTISSAYAMLNDLEINAAVGEYVTFSANFTGKKAVSESTPTPSYAAENFFRARDCTVKFADSEAGLSGATAVELTRVKLTINKNLYVHHVLWSVDVDSIYNQQFTVTGDMELLWEADTYLALARANTAKFMSISLVNTDVTLSWGWNPTVTLTLGKVKFEEWDITDDNNGIVKQTVGFVGAFNNTEGYTIKASLINSKASY